MPMTEPTIEDPQLPDEEPRAEEYTADGESVVSDETGTRYDPLGQADATPEDEEAWTAADDE
jgi:hypothetical protein